MIKISNISAIKFCILLITISLFNVEGLIAQDVKETQEVQKAPILKLGYFDSKAIFESIPERATIQSEIEAIQAKFEVEETKMLEEYKVKVANFLEEKDELNENIAEARAQEIDQLQQRIEQFRERSAKDLRQTQENLLAPLFERISLSIRTIGDYYGYACIFDISEGGISYISPTICEDCTALINKALGIQ